MCFMCFVENSSQELRFWRCFIILSVRFSMLIIPHTHPRTHPRPVFPFSDENNFSWICLHIACILLLLAVRWVPNTINDFGLVFQWPCIRMMSVFGLTFVRYVLGPMLKPMLNQAWSTGDGSSSMCVP